MKNTPCRPRFLFLFLSTGFLALCVGGCTASKNMDQEHVWPAPPDSARIRYLETLADGSVMPRSFFASLFETLSGVGYADVHLGKPLNVAADDWGRVYVTDLELRRVVIFDFVEKRMRFLGDAAPGQLYSPMGITVHDTLVFVTDNHLGQVIVFNSLGRSLRTIGSKQDLTNPVAIVYHPDSKRVYVADSKSHEIIVYSFDGQLLFRFGAKRDWIGGLYFPTALWIYDEKLYVVDSMGFRVAVYDLEGSFLSAFGEPGSAPGFFARPKGIAVSGDGKIFVTDAAFNNFQVFDQQGQVYMFVGTAGLAPGEFQIPSGLFIDKQNRVLVVDQINRRIQIFRYLGE